MHQEDQLYLISVLLVGFRIETVVNDFPCILVKMLEVIFFLIL